MTSPAPAASCRVAGRRYRCRLEYRRQDIRLDPLAQFVLDAIRLGETALPVLVDEFALPPRMMLDILTDLVRRNLVGLSLSSGKAVALAGAADTLVVPPSTRVVEVWEDSVTGALLPMYRIRPYKSEFGARA